MTVAAQSVAIQFILAPVLPAFHERYPDIRIDLRDAGVRRDDGWLLGDHRSALDAPVFAGQTVGRLNDLTATQGLRDGTLEPVLLDWVGQHSPPLNVLIRKAVSRQPRVRALVDFLAEVAQRMAADRLPAGLPPVPTAQKPEWFKRRVG